MKRNWKQIIKDRQEEDKQEETTCREINSETPEYGPDTEAG